MSQPPKRNNMIDEIIDRTTDINTINLVLHKRQFVLNHLAFILIDIKFLILNKLKYIYIIYG